MKLNNKGFAISTVMYMILILAVILIIAILSILSARKLILDNIKKEVIANINSNISIPDVICKAVKEDEAGSVKRGVEYKCQVNDTTSYNFYVLSTEGDNVNLMMSDNIDSNYYTFAAMSEEESSLIGYNIIPTVLTQAQKLTTSWTYISKYVNVEYTDKESYYTTELTGRARLPKYSEIAALCPCEGTENLVYGGETESGGYRESDVETNPDRNNCESWVLGDYWTMDFAKITGNSAAAWGVNTEYNTLDDFDVAASNIRTLGIRPVITIQKTRLEGYNPDTDDSADDEDPTCPTSGSGSSGDSTNTETLDLAEHIVTLVEDEDNFRYDVTIEYTYTTTNRSQDIYVMSTSGDCDGFSTSINEEKTSIIVDARYVDLSVKNAKTCTFKIGIDDNVYDTLQVTVKAKAQEYSCVAEETSFEADLEGGIEVQVGVPWCVYLGDTPTNDCGEEVLTFTSPGSYRESVILCPGDYEDEFDVCFTIVDSYEEG